MKTKRRKPRKAKKHAKRARKPRKASRRGSGLLQMKYRVSPDLEEIVGAKVMTRPQIVKKLWVYIKAKKCQSSQNRRMIVPDAKLSRVLGSRPIDMLKMATHLNKHIKK